MIRVEILEDKGITASDFECRDSSMGFAARLEERIKGLENPNKLFDILKNVWRF